MLLTFNGIKKMLSGHTWLKTKNNLFSPDSVSLIDFLFSAFCRRLSIGPVSRGPYLSLMAAV